MYYLYDRKLSSRTIARKISALKALFLYLNSRHEIKNIAQELIVPKIKKSLPVYLSEQEIERLFDVAEQDSSALGLRNKIMLYVMYASGMRVTELTQLKIANFQFDASCVLVAGKGGKERLVPIPESILAMVKEYIRSTREAMIKKWRTAHHDDYLFPILYGGRIKPISRQMFWVILKKLWASAGIEREISPHKLRHSFATHMLKKGANLRSLQILLGHENLATVQVYTHVEKSYARKVYDKKHPRS